MDNATRELDRDHGLSMLRPATSKKFPKPVWNKRRSQPPQNNCQEERKM
ncbi:uncharacterized protein G2W53_041113 [Senna tora]|uniref:Uncharacterized protein n=1 Tax=Senna tora TaxID=362788 RepID=A0A834SEU8_9FABA|nr:uncharacterized protein G2W53_041113 [Senna tora]